MTILQATDLRAGYGSTEILHGVSLHVGPGETVGIFGRNGVGKTTLLRTIMGEVAIQAGSVTALGHNLDRVPTHQIVRLGVSYAAQDHAVFATLSVRDNLELAGLDLNSPDVEALMDLFPRVRQRLNQHAGTLSGGEQKMLLATRAFGSNAQLVVLDEIVEGVQPSAIEWFQAAISRAKDQGRSVLLVEQHLDFALGVADSYHVLSAGSVVDTGTVDQDTTHKVRGHLVL